MCYLNTGLVALTFFLFTNVGHGVAVAEDLDRKRTPPTPILTITSSINTRRNLYKNSDFKFNCTLEPGVRPECTVTVPSILAILNDDEYSQFDIEISCESDSYPVIWGVYSVKQQGVYRIANARKLEESLAEPGKTFPKVLGYSTTLKLSYYLEDLRQNYTVAPRPEAPALLVCGAVNPKNRQEGTTSAILTFQTHMDGTNTSIVGLLRLEQNESLPLQKWWSQEECNHLSANRTDPRLKFEKIPQKDKYDRRCTFRCCFDHQEAIPGATVQDIRIWSSEWCSNPLNCFSLPDYRLENHPKTDDSLEYEEDMDNLAIHDEEDDSKNQCSTIILRHCSSGGSNREESFTYMCDVDVNGRTRTNETNPLSLIHFGGNQTRLEYASAWNETQGFTSEWRRANVDEPGKEVAHFTIGDSILLTCEASTFTYASTLVWELQYDDGTSEFRVGARNPHSTLDSSMDSVQKIPILKPASSAHLSSVSCHLAPWATTSWVTKTVHIVTNRESSPSSRASVGPKNVTFPSNETAYLVCDLQGEPVPKIEWVIHKSPGTDLYWLEEDFGDDGDGHGRRATKARVSLSSYTMCRLDPKINPLPPLRVSCVGSNPSGNASQEFTVQAYRPVPPTMPEDLTPVGEDIWVRKGDALALLNCVLTAPAMPPAQFQWTRTRAPFDKGQPETDAGRTLELVTEDSGHVTIIQGGRSHSHSPLWSALILTNVRPEDEGLYVCVAVNKFGSSTKVFAVRIEEQTSIVEQPDGSTNSDSAAGAGIESPWLMILVVGGFTRFIRLS